MPSAPIQRSAASPRANAGVRPFGVLWLQLFAFNLLAFLVLIGRKLEAGDTPNAPLFLAVYALVILAALVLVVRAFVRDRRRLVQWVLRIVARARRRPVLATYLAILLVVGASYAITVMIPLIREAIDGLWSDDKRDSGSYVLLFVALFLTIDLGAVAAALAWLAWGPDTRARRARRRALAN